ncbi:MAG: DUF4349 domain-containing protein [Solirubrobacterales bacterium]|nr:DUF4349 domain-containing protein [Solirubrobacterales bacterium]
MTDHTLTPEQERELRAIEAGAEGRPVDADLTDFSTLAADLVEARPEPRPDFTTRLDRAVADSFPADWLDEAEAEEAAGTAGGGAEENDPRQSVAGGSRAGSRLDRFRRRFGPGRRIALPLATGLAGVLVVTTVVVAGLQGGGNPAGPTDGVGSDEPSVATEGLAEPKLEGLSDRSATEAGRAAPQSTSDATNPAVASASGSTGSGSQGRKVAGTARITLGTDPDGVQEVANEIVAVTDDHHGIVIESSVSDGEVESGGARFRLSIPSARLDSAIAALSGIADLRARTQETEDVTAPYNTVSDRLSTSRARIESLLGELEGATTSEDRIRIERRLRRERRTAGSLQQQMNRLKNRVTMTPVAVTVVADAAGSEDSGWGVSDAYDDAGRLLGIAAGVALIALAVAIPIGLMMLIAFAINRAWLNRARQRVLEDH